MVVLIDATATATGTGKRATVYRYLHKNGKPTDEIPLSDFDCLCNAPMHLVVATGGFGRCDIVEECCEEEKTKIHQRMNAFWEIRRHFLMAIHAYMEKNGTGRGQAFAFACCNQAVSFKDEARFAGMYLGLGMRDLAYMIAEVVYSVEKKDEDEMMHVPYYCIERDQVDDDSLAAAKKALDDAGLKVCSWAEAGYIDLQL